MSFVSESDCQEVAARAADVLDAFSGRTIVLTGAGGFLGQYLQEVFAWLNRHALARPARIIGLDNLITGRGRGEGLPGLPEGIELRHHDVIEPIDIEEPIDYVVHAAGIASPYHYRAYPLETLEVATVGTRNMLELARRHRARVLYFSSSEIYGDPDPAHVPTPESYRGNVSCQGPRACYDESKRLGETLCYIYHTHHGVAVNTVRPFNVFGPGMREDDYRVLPNFASRIRSGKPLGVYGSGRQTRTYCYVTDAVNGFLRVLARGVPGEAYNIGQPSPELSVLELVARIEALLGRTLEKVVLEYPDSYPADEPQRRCPDIRKARLQVGYEPAVSLEEGLRRFLEWTEHHYEGSA